MAAALLCAMESIAQKKGLKLDSLPVAPVVKADSASPLKPKSYNSIITGKAVTSKGFITVHKLDGNYYFEIPDSLLGRDILLVLRVSPKLFLRYLVITALFWLNSSK